MNKAVNPCAGGYIEPMASYGGPGFSMHFLCGSTPPWFHEKLSRETTILMAPFTGHGIHLSGDRKWLYALRPWRFIWMLESHWGQHHA